VWREVVQEVWREVVQEVPHVHLRVNRALIAP
jgi:hypothetical protein